MATTSSPTRRRSASPTSRGDQVTATSADHGEVGEHVLTDHLERQLAPVRDMGDATGAPCTTWAEVTR